MPRGKAEKTMRMMGTIKDALAKCHPMTVRQTYYQLVSRQVIENSRSEYMAVSRLLVEMRQSGEVPWAWIEDRIRRPRTVSMWDSLQDFGETAVKAYRLDVWKHQDTLVEVWLEKDALSGIFEEVLGPYGVTLNVGRGYDGWSSIHAAAERYRGWGGEVIVPYFGDFDPSGEDMLRSLQERLAYFGTSPRIEKVAITKQDISDYELPPDVTKAADSRRASFVAKWGDNAVELDALPVQVLRDRVRGAVEDHMDLEALAEVRKQEVGDKTIIQEAFR
jgi:hypothetical protein